MTEIIKIKDSDKVKTQKKTESSTATKLYVPKKKDNSKERKGE